MNKASVALGFLFLALTVGDAVLTPLTMQSAPAAESLQTAGASVGKAAPDFSLPNTSGQTKKLSEYKGKFVVLEWNNPDCPFVKKHYESNNMQSLQSKYTKEGVVWLTINSSAKGKQGNYPPAELGTLLKSKNAAATEVLIDEDGSVGHLYGAKATPHMFVIDKTGSLIYAGAIDDKNTADAADIKSAVNYVAAALDAAMAGKPVATSSTRAYGCSVKYAQ
jgi:peroxiredoxin